MGKNEFRQRSSSLHFQMGLFSHMKLCGFSVETSTDSEAVRCLAAGLKQEREASAHLRVQGPQVSPDAELTSLPSPQDIRSKAAPAGKSRVATSDFPL